MPTVLIIVDSPARKTSKQVTALKQAIASQARDSVVMSAIATEDLATDFMPLGKWGQPTIYCPLTLDLPDNFTFPGDQIYRACRQVEETRTWAAQQFRFQEGEGNYWLPAIATEAGILYGKIIGRDRSTQTYQQPISLPIEQYQSLCHLTERLMDWLEAPPAVYLLKFGLESQKIVFDSLQPFPGESAIASVGVQQPDLFACHWLCLTGQPIPKLEYLGTD